MFSAPDWKAFGGVQVAQKAEFRYMAWLIPACRARIARNLNDTAFKMIANGRFPQAIGGWTRQQIVGNGGIGVRIKARDPDLKFSDQRRTAELSSLRPPASPTVVSRESCCQTLPRWRF